MFAVAITIRHGRHREAMSQLRIRCWDMKRSKPFSLEFDDDRSGDFQPLRFVPETKKVVLGLVTSKNGALEEKESLIARIKEASQYVPLERLSLSPQCGFASTEEGNILSEEDQWKKLQLIIEVADEVWGTQPVTAK